MLFRVCACASSGEKDSNHSRMAAIFTLTVATCGPAVPFRMHGEENRSGDFLTSTPVLPQQQTNRKGREREQSRTSAFGRASGHALLTK